MVLVRLVVGTVGLSLGCTCWLGCASGFRVRGKALACIFHFVFLRAGSPGCTVQSWGCVLRTPGIMGYGELLTDLCPLWE